MKLGIPTGLLFSQYETFVTTFFRELGADVLYTGATDQETLNLGSRHCVDEACLPIKLFHGQVKRLLDQCDYVVVPRLMRCEFGEAICPKFSGLPDLVLSGVENAKIAFTEPLHLDDQARMTQSLVKDGTRLGFSEQAIRTAAALAWKAQTAREQSSGEKAAKPQAAKEQAAKGQTSKDHPISIFLAGHPYHIHDSFLNLGIHKKLDQLGIRVITHDAVSQEEKETELSGLMKQPYWMFFTQNYGAGRALVRKGEIQGILYLSSFNCGTDSFTIEMLKHAIGDFPMMVLKLDEQTGEAGCVTRLEAFADLLRKGRIALS